MPLSIGSSGYQPGNAPSTGGAIASDEGDGYSLEKLRQQYLDFQNSKSEEIEEQRTARHYYHDDQLTRAQIRVLEKRRQPVVINNRIRRKIDAVTGLVERLKQDPKAFARTPKHEDGADVATGTIRYVLDAQEWSTLSPEAARGGAINGIAGIELSLEQGDKGDPDVGMAPVDADTFFYDPRSVRFDFSDARFMGVAKWIDLEVAEEMFPDKADELQSLISSGTSMESWQQADRERRWIDTNTKRLFLIEQWHIIRGEWRYCFYAANTKLAEGASPFVDEKGKTLSRYIMFSVNIDHDGDRYGFVRTLKWLQDEINARRSKALHLLNTRRIVYEKGAVDDPEKTRQEAVRPDGMMEVNPGGKRFEFDDQAKYADMQGQLEFLDKTITDIENFGPNPAVIGQGIENSSGRAIALLQQAGIAELGPFILAYRGWKIRVYRAVWNILQRYWTAERWIRVTDDEGLAQFIQLNRLQLDESGYPVISNQIGALDVDIILDEGPDTINLMQDTYDTLTALASRGAQVPPDILIELAPLPAATKRKLLDRLEKAQQGDPQAKQLQIADATATIRGKQASAAKDAASARKTMAEVPATRAKTTKDRASAFREIADAAIAIKTAAQPAGPRDAAGPRDGGIGGFGV